MPIQSTRQDASYRPGFGDRRSTAGSSANVLGWYKPGRLRRYFSLTRVVVSCSPSFWCARTGRARPMSLVRMRPLGWQSCTTWAPNRAPQSLALGILYQDKWKPQAAELGFLRVGGARATPGTRDPWEAWLVSTSSAASDWQPIAESTRSTTKTAGGGRP